ncbi:cutinase transcription factor 1 [Rhypophila decipiens]
MSDSERDSSSSSASPEPGDYATGNSPAREATTPPETKVNAGGGGSPKSPSKRKAEGSINPAKPTKRRAARACGQCRARKVRCDVTDRHPCNNCVLDKVECQLQESKRRKKPLGSTLRATVPYPQHNVAAYGANMPALHLRGGGSEYRGHGSFPNLANTAGPPRISGQPLVSITNAVISPWQAVMNMQPPPNAPPAPNPRARLPSFIKPLPSDLEKFKLDICFEHGALEIPSKDLQDALLVAYMQFVHPFMPLLELGQVMRILGGEEPEGKISLSLYQAVMFVAVAFVDEQHLRAAGFESRKAARKKLYNKVRLLYDFDTEDDRLVTVQTLLLMTYWYETPDDKKDTWHWMGIAVSMAHTIGLHRDPASLPILDERKRKLYKRIWWSVYMRDRLIALGMRRPSRIEETNYDVPMLEMSDFEIGELSSNAALASGYRLIWDGDLQQQLALMCIEKAKLCRIIHRIIKLQYSVLARGGVLPDNTTESTVMLMPKKDLDNFESVQGLDAELSEWLEKLPECCQFQPLTEANTSDGYEPLALNRTLLHMLHRATVAALHRPHFADSSPHVPGDMLNMTRLRVTESAVSVITMASQLRHFGLDRYLPTTSVTAILPALIMHIFEMRGSGLAAKQAVQRFLQGMSVLEQLRDSYNSADFALRFLQEAVRRSNLDLAVANGRLGMYAPMSEPSLANPIQFLAPEDMHLEMKYGDHPGELGQFYAPGADQPGSRARTTTDDSLDLGTVAPRATVNLHTDLLENNMDFDQWIESGAEGVNSSDEAMGLFNTGGATRRGPYHYDIRPSAMEMMTLGSAGTAA